MSKEEKNNIVPKLRFREFKNSEEWQKETLGKLGNLINGLTYSPDDIRENGLLVLRSSNIQNGEIVLGDNVYVRPDIKGANISQPNDILICVRNGSKALIGKNAIIPDGMPLSTHGAFMTVFRSHVPKFVFQLFQTGAYDKQVSGDLGATINSINGSNFIKYKFFVPINPKEQQKIADCLSSLDELIRAENQKLEAFKAHKKGLMQQLFPGEGETVPKRRFKEFRDSGKWEKKEMQELISPNEKYGIVDGPFGSNLKTIHYKTEGIPIITSGYVTEGRFHADKYLYVTEEKFKEERRSAVKAGDIVMAKIGARCGASAILPVNHPTGILSGNALKISVDELRFSTQFIWQQLWQLYLSKKLNVLIITGAQPAISMASLKKFALLIPSLKKEQQKIANCLCSLDELITAQGEKIEQLKQHKKGLMQGLFPT